MKRFLRYCLGIFAALLLIYFWPSSKPIDSIHLIDGTTYTWPYHVKEHTQGVEFDVRIDGHLRHVHWNGSYVIDYAKKP